MKALNRQGWVALGVVVAALLAWPAYVGTRSLVMTRGGMATLTRLVSAANAGDLDRVRELCTSRYLTEHPLKRLADGGVAGIPRNIHRNFKAWTEGDEVWICPADRVGVVVRLVKDGNLWKFDGLVGLLRSGGRVEVMLGGSEDL